MKPNEKIEKEDLQRLLRMINYNKDSKITFKEFEIFYLKSILGS